MTDKELIQAMADAMWGLLVVMAGISDDPETAKQNARNLIAQAKEHTKNG